MMRRISMALTLVLFSRQQRLRRSSRRRPRSSAPSPTAAALVLPGAQVVAVNIGTKDTYEATTNAEGYYNIQFVRTGNYDITVTLTGFQTFKATGVEVATNQVVRTNATLQVGGVTEIGQRRGRRRRCSTPTARRSPKRSASARSWSCRLSGRNVWSLAEHDARRPRRHQQRHRPELPRRRPARDPEQPVARRHQRLVQPAGGDQHAPDRRRRHRSAGADRQHLGGVRLVPRRPHQRRDQERHEHAARRGVRLLPGRRARRARLLREPRATRRIRASATSSASRSTARS